MSDLPEQKFRHPRPNRTREHSQAMHAYNVTLMELRSIARREPFGGIGDEDHLLQSAVNFADARRECEDLGMFERPREDLALLVRQLATLTVDGRFHPGGVNVDVRVHFTKEAGDAPAVHSAGQAIARLIAVAVTRVLGTLRTA